MPSAYVPPIMVKPISLSRLVTSWKSASPSASRPLEIASSANAWSA